MENKNCFADLLLIYLALGNDRRFDGSLTKKKILEALESLPDKEIKPTRRDSDYYDLATIYLNEDNELLGCYHDCHSEDHSFDDPDKGIAYLKKCSPTREDALGALGCYYALGLHLPRDEEKAKELIDKAPLYEQCYIRIGDYLFHKDPAKAFHFYCLGDERGEEDSAFKKGYCLLMGIGTNKDESQGFKTILDSIDIYRPDPTSSYWLAYCYLKGIGTGADILKAKKFYGLYKESADCVNGLPLYDPMGIVKAFECGRH